MSAPVSIRLGEETRKRVAKLARHKNVSPSKWMRQAIEHAAQEAEQQLAPYELIKDLLGVVRGGDPSRSTWPASKISQLIKRRRRRS